MSHERTEYPFADFDWKRIRFNMTDLHWQQEFLEFSGLDFLFYQLGKVILNLKYRAFDPAL